MWTGNGDGGGDGLGRFRLIGRGGEPARQGQDVSLSCETPSVTGAIQLMVGWQWQQMAPNGLARMIALASPLPRK